VLRRGDLFVITVLIHDFKASRDKVAGELEWIPAVQNFVTKKMKGAELCEIKSRTGRVSHERRDLPPQPADEQTF